MAVTIRKNDARAAKLYLMSFGVHVIALLLFQPPIITSHFLFWGAFVFTLVVCCAISAGIWKGYRWVKLLFIAVVAWDTVSYLARFVGPAGQAGANPMDVFALALQSWAVIILLKDLLAPTALTATYLDDDGATDPARQL